VFLLKHFLEQEFLFTSRRRRRVVLAVNNHKFGVYCAARHECLCISTTTMNEYEIQIKPRYSTTPRNRNRHF
jgi:hypothetical protein